MKYVIFPNLTCRTQVMAGSIAKLGMMQDAMPYKFINNAYMVPYGRRYYDIMQGISENVIE